METLIQFAPVQALHFIIDIIKLAVHPIYNRIEISLDFVYVVIAAMGRHIAIHIPFAYPFRAVAKNC